MNMNADLNQNVTRRSEKDMPMKMKSRYSGHRWLALLIAVAVTAVPLAAQAQRKSPLADAPAIRKKFELRASRFEVGAGFGSTINQDFYHTFFFNLRLAFHINDWLTISGIGSFGVANVTTTFQNDLVNSLNTSRGSTQPISEPTQQEAINSMQKINGVYALQLEFVPFAGKYSFAGVAFAHYDFYIFGGGGAISVSPTNSSTPPACQPTNSANNQADMLAYSCGVSGTKLGGTFGIGLHSYFNHWLALNVELRDFLAELNPSGRDTNADLHADNNDLTWTHTIMLGVNLVAFLPPTPAISP